MASSREKFLGRFMGADDDGMVWVYKQGRDFRITYGGKSHLCHRSIKDVHDIPREAMMVFHVDVEAFLPA